MTPVDGSCISIGVQFGVQWLADNWFLVLTACVTVLTAGVAVYGVILGRKSLGLARALAKREVTEDVSIKQVFLTHKHDHLRVEIVNHGTISVPIRTVGLYKPTDEPPYILQWCKGDNDSPLEARHHSFYTRPVAEVLGFMEVPGAYIAVMSNKGELAKSEADAVASLVAKAQAAR